MRSDVYLNAKPDTSLKTSLLSLFQKIKIPDDSKALFVENILLKVTWRENFKKYTTNNPSPAEHNEKIKSYIESIEATRKAWLALPLVTKHALPEMISEVTSSLLNTSLLSSEFYKDKSNLPKWRLDGMSNLESWGADLEMIDLLKATAEHWKDKYFIEFNRRDSSHIGLIAGIAESCTQHGIKISHAPRSYFVQILMLVFPNLESPRAAIKEAMQLLQRSDYTKS